MATLTSVVGLIAGSGLLGWAFLWPQAGCSEPACVRERFRVAVEVDAFRQVPAIPFEVVAEDRSISLRSILQTGGVDTTLIPNEFELPYKAASGALDRADLYRFAIAWRNAKIAPGVDAKIYALLAPALVSDTGESLFGIMFDLEARTGFAVAPAATAHWFAEREPATVPLLQLRTFVHELLHALNRRHMDAVQMPDGRLTLEAPTRCLVRQSGTRWSLREPPLMALSPSTIYFFQTAAKDDVLPGTAYGLFQLRRASPNECDDARFNTASNPARTRAELAIRRLRNLLSVRAAAAAEPERQVDAEPASAPVELRVQAIPAPYPLGYPIAVRVIARNGTGEALPIRGRLSPSYGMVRIEHRRADESEWSLFEPLAWFEPMGDEHALLPPGEVTEHTVPIYFGDQGWTFPDAGEYDVRVRLQTGDDVADIASMPVRIEIASPRNDQDVAALQPLIDDRGALSERIGRILAFGGRVGDEPAWASLDAAIQEQGHTALGRALRLTLITQRLRPSIDPLTGERPAPDFTDAREWLIDTCSDSGVAALKWQLLQRHAGALPSGLSNRAETGAAAWDGTTSIRGATMPTYSDPDLQLWGPSLHFCFDESHLRGSIGRAIPPLAQQLRRQKPPRIVIVGHGDAEGTCRYNDALGLRRAANVRRALRAAGLRAPRIDIASLGERRPLDFASMRAAHDLNRRVEILIEGSSPDEVQAPLAPRCPVVAGDSAGRDPKGNGDATAMVRRKKLQNKT